MVFALTVFGASPALHDWLHFQGSPAGDDACAVMLFASGVPLASGTPNLLPPSAAWREPSRVEVADFFLVSPRYLRQPERGPPVR
jgi:hypothetical protein